MVKKDYKEDPGKLAYHMSEINFLADNFSREERKDMEVLFLPGLAEAEYHRVFEPLGFNPDRIIGVERDKQIHAKLKKNSPDYNLFGKPITLLDYLKSNDKVFDFINYDPSTILANEMIENIQYIFTNQRIKQPKGALGVSIYGMRGHKKHSRLLENLKKKFVIEGKVYDCKNPWEFFSKNGELMDKGMQKGTVYTKFLIETMSYGKAFHTPDLVISKLDSEKLKQDFIDIAAKNEIVLDARLYDSDENFRKDTIEIYGSKSALNSAMRMCKASLKFRINKEPALRFRPLPHAELNPYFTSIKDQLVASNSFFPEFDQEMREFLALNLTLYEFRIRNNAYHPHNIDDGMNRGKYVGRDGGLMYFDFIRVTNYEPLGSSELIKISEGRRVSFHIEELNPDLSETDLVDTLIDFGKGKDNVPIHWRMKERIDYGRFLEI